jgi:hypothetical protein
MTRLGANSLLAALALPENDAPTHPAPFDASWDLTWIDRLTGKYRAVFDAPGFADGTAIVRSMLWCDEYKDVYGTTRAAMSAVLVLRHTGIWLALSDAYWKRFKVGKEISLRSPDGGRWAEENPALSTAPGTPAAFSRYTLPQFISEGGIALACDLSLRQAVRSITHADALDDAAAGERAREALVPGVILQPSGVFAALRAQEAGCKYIVAS